MKCSSSFTQLTLTNCMIRLDEWRNSPRPIEEDAKASWFPVIVKNFSILSATLQRKCNMLTFKTMLFQIICNDRNASATSLYFVDYHVADVAEGLQGICHIIYLWFRVLGNGCRCVCGFYEIRRLIVSTSFKLFDNFPKSPFIRTYTAEIFTTHRFNVITNSSCTDTNKFR